MSLKQLNMYYELSAFYKRDLYFAYSEENSLVILNWRNLIEEGKSLIIEKPIIYEVNKIDNYINDYDILPTFDTPLVSEKFKNSFQDITGKEIELYPTIIFDRSNKNKTNENFFALNVLNITSCMDTEKSIVEKRDYGATIIKKLFFKPGSLNDLKISRMEEDKFHIIVSEEFKKKCKSEKLKGFHFIEEGYSIFTDL